jgi:hypothetical protein
MAFEKLLDEIMNTDKNIRYATVCDMEGKEAQTRIRDGITPLLNEDETKETLHYAASAWKSRNKFAPKIGKGKYVLAVYENLRRLTLPLGTDHILLVTWGIDGGQADIIERIQNILSGDYTRDW